MLTKLLKYEYKSTAKTFWPLSFGLLLCSMFMGLSMRYSDAAYNPLLQGSILAPGMMNWQTGMQLNEHLFQLASICYIVLMVAMFVMLLVSICTRFQRNLLESEGYLMHTLPTTPAMHIISKALVALFWAVMSAAAMVLSFVVLFAFIFVGSGIDFTPVWRVILQELDVNFLAVLPWMLVAYIEGILRIYLSIMLGHQCKKHPTVVAIVAYFAIGYVQTLLLSLLGSVFETPIQTLFQRVSLQQLGIISSIAGMVCFGVCAAAYFFATEYLLRKRLNLV